MRVLLIDDNESIRGFVSESLRMRGWEVHEEPDGVEGLAALSSHSYDLIVTDVVMPRLDGIGVVSAARLRAQSERTPIIVMSSAADFTLEILGDCVDRLLQPSSKAR